MFRMVGLVVGLLIVAIGIAIAVMTWSDWRRNSADRKQRQQQVAFAKSAEAARKAAEPPPLPPVIEPEEIRRILAQAKPQPPKEIKGDLTWQQIESTIDQLRQERRERPQAGHDLENWYAALSKPTFTGSKGFAEHIEKLTEWLNERPDSPTPLVVLANAHISHAWEARGEGYALTVTEEGWKLFNERMERAEPLLKKAIALGAKDAHAQALLIDIANAQGWPRAKTDAVVEEGRTLDPSYGLLYRSMANYLLPRWHGEPGDIERFAADAARIVGGDDGLDAYGQIAASTNRYEPDLLFYGGYDRKLLAKAAEVAVRRYPHAQNLTCFAAVCTVAAQDHRAARLVKELLQPGEAPNVPNWRVVQPIFDQWCSAREIPSGETDWVWGAFSTYGDIAFDSDSRFIWCGDGYSYTPVKLLNIETKQIELSLSGPPGSFNDLAFDASRQRLVGVFTSRDFTGWILWDTKQPDEPVIHSTNDICRAVAISPKADQIAWSMGNSVYTLDLKMETEGPKIDTKGVVHFLKYSRDGKLLALGSSGRPAVHDATTGEKRYDVNGLNIIEIDEEQRAWVAEHASGRPLAQPLVRYSADGQSRETIIADLGPSGMASAISADHRLLAIAGQAMYGRAEPISVWDLSTGKLRKRLGGHWNHIGTLTFSSDGRKLASIATSGGPIKIWSLDDDSL